MHTHPRSSNSSRAFRRAHSQVRISMPPSTITVINRNQCVSIYSVINLPRSYPRPQETPVSRVDGDSVLLLSMIDTSMSTNNKLFVLLVSD